MIDRLIINENNHQSEPSLKLYMVKNKIHELSGEYAESPAPHRLMY